MDEWSFMEYWKYKYQRKIEGVHIGGVLNIAGKERWRGKIETF